MARTSKLTKTISEANLGRLGASRLASVLVEASAADPLLKRRLRLELAAELGAADLALELDKRIQTLITSRARISWRKRPELLRELGGLRSLIVDRLFSMDQILGLERLYAWFDAATPLAARLKDPKGELGALYDEATPDLARLASLVGPARAAPWLADAVETRSTPWAGFVGRAAPHMSISLARELLTRLTGGAPPTGRRALVIRRLADRAGDLESWLLSFTDEDRRRPDTGGEIARRLAEAGRPVEARAALDLAAAPPARRGWRAATAEPIGETWRTAEISVLEAEGRKDDAMTARWAQFERTLSPDVLKALISELGDFDDVIAIDRAVQFAAGYFDLMRGLAFLMNWGAQREASDAIVNRATEIKGNVEAVSGWASRLAGRYPLAAVLLLRARVVSLVALGAWDSSETAATLSEVESLATELAIGEVDPHAVFLARLAVPNTRIGSAAAAGRRGAR